MDVLESVIFSLTSDEVRRFKILSNRFKADEEKKLLVLFDSIRSEKFVDDDAPLVCDLYGANNPKTRNRYYRLRNKLLDNIEKSLIFYHFKYQDAIHAYYDIQLATMFMERTHYRLATYFLKKAEKKARDQKQYSILEQIYCCYVRLAANEVEIDIDAIMERRRKNDVLLAAERRDAEVIALITQRLKKANFSRGQTSVLSVLKSVRESLEGHYEIYTHAQGRIKIFHTVSGQLIQRKAWPQLVTYLQHEIDTFRMDNFFNEENHKTLLLMRLWLVRSLYRTFKFQQAADQVKVFEQEMKMYNRQDLFTYLFRYYEQKINLLKSMGKPEEAEQLVREALRQDDVREEPTNECLLFVRLADQQFNNRRFHDAISTLARAKSSTGYESLDEESRMFIEIFEMVNHYEAGDYSFMDTHLKAFRKRYKKLIKNQHHGGTLRFLEILNRMNSAEIEGRRVSLRAAYKGFKQHFNAPPREDNQIILYDVYLQSRLDQRPYYDLFTERMQSMV